MAKKDKPFGDDQNILTHEDLKEEVGEKTPSPVKKSEKKKPVNVKFECPFAPMGASKTVLKHIFPGKDKKEKIYEIEMMNKVYTIPNNLTDGEKVLLRQVLIENGFRDVTKIDAGVTYDKEKKQYVYTVVHPEHTDRNPINGNISLVLKDEKGNPVFDVEGKQIFRQVSIVNGIVKTDDEKIYQALLDAGFYSGHKKVRE